MVNLVILAALVLALIYLPLTGAGPSARRSALKTAPVAVLAVGALAFGPLWLALGLGLSALGDWALSRDGDRAFLAGLISFAAAHLAYIALFSGAQVPLGALVLLALAISTEFWLIPHTGALRWPVRGYVGIICVMGAFALGLPQARLGAGVFIVSDLILAVQLFRLRPGTALYKLAGRALWGLYIAAQALIFAGFVGPSLP